MSAKSIIDTYKQGFKTLKSYWPPILLVLITVIISFLNYQPGTWLTGWDNLHPEFYPTLNLQRAVFTVWQEYQSLGLLGGMGHAADLPRQLILFLFYPAVPASFIRYLWTFAMLALGPLGVYFAIKDHFLHSQNPIQKKNLFQKLKAKIVKTPIFFDQRTRTYAAFLGGLYYLLNLGTVQQFFTPFETFTTYHAAFPWIIYTLLSYLKKPNRKNLSLFALTLFLAAPSFYVETLFVTLCLSLLPIFIEYFPTGSVPVVKQGRTLFKAGFTIFITQAFWLLPVIFFVLTNGDVGTKSHINLISSPETYYRNLEFGNLANLSLLKGFWFKYIDLISKDKFGFLMGPWVDHLNDPVIITVGFFFFALIISGIYYSLKKNLYMGRGLFGILGISYFFLAGGGLLINNKIPLIGELFRSPFTKFDTPLTFVYAIFFSIGIILLLDIFSLLHTHLTYPATLFTISFLLILFTAPIFQGQLISPAMRQKIPQEYWQVFKFFKNQDPNERIANFPQHTHWGWNFYDWPEVNPIGGYRGSGFLWYGLSQPLLDRAFDVWEKSGETAFEKIQAALYSQDQDKFVSLIKHYDIDWILIDKYIYTPSQPTDLYNEKLEKILVNSGQFTQIRNFNDKIIIYKVNTKSSQNFLGVKNQDQEIPLLNLSLRPQTNLPSDSESWEINTNSITLPIPTGPDPVGLNLPSYTDTENIVPVQIDYQKQDEALTLRITPILPQINDITPKATPNIISLPIPAFQNSFILKINDQYLDLVTPAEATRQTEFTPLTKTHLPTKDTINLSLFSGQSTPPLNITSFFESQNPKQCYTNNPEASIEKVVTGNFISLFGVDVVGCLSAKIPAQNNLISLSFEHSSSTNTKANINITDQNLNADPTRSTPLKTTSIPKKETIYYTTTIQNPQINLILEANETSSLQEITYKNITLKSYTLIGDNSFTLNHIDQTTLNTKASNIKIPIIESPLTIHQTAQNNTLPSEARNCSQFNQDLFTKEVKDNQIIYTAKNAITCDYLSLPELPHNTNYLISLKTATLKGLPQTICLENHTTRRCDVFERLIDSSSEVAKRHPRTVESKWNTIINPISNPNEPEGYTLHLNTQSFGSRVSKNSLEEILLTPLSLNYLQQITIKQNNSSEVTGTGSSDGEILQSTHPAPFIYTARIDHSSVLNLYQTYSPYWKAIIVSKKDTTLPTLQLIFKLPYLYFKGSLLGRWPEGTPPRWEPQAKRVDWHNSWETPTGESSLIIFYLPQYLEFAGFILLLTSPILYRLHKK